MFPFPEIIKAQQERDHCFEGRRSTRWGWILEICLAFSILSVFLIGTESSQLRLIAVLPIAACFGFILATIQETSAQRAMKNDPRFFIIGTAKSWEEMFEVLQRLAESLSDAPIPKAHLESWLEQTRAALQKLESSLEQERLGLGKPGDPTIDELIADFERLAADSGDKKLEEIASLENIRRALDQRGEIPEA